MKMPQYLRKKYRLWNKPIKVGNTVVGLAKYPMFDFHCYVLEHFNCFVFYADTDLLLYRIKQ